MRALARNSSRPVRAEAERRRRGGGARPERPYPDDADAAPSDAGTDRLTPYSLRLRSRGRRDAAVDDTPSARPTEFHTDESHNI